MTFSINLSSSWIIFLLLAKLLFISPQASAQTEKDFLEKLNGIQDDSIRATIYIDLHNAVFKTDLKKAEEYAWKIVNYAKAAHANSTELSGYRALARCGRKIRDYSKVLHYDSLAMQVAKRKNIPIEVLTMEIDFATDFMDGEMPEKAISHLRIAEELAKDINDIGAFAKVQNRLGWYYGSQYQYTEAIIHFDKSFKTYQLLGDKKMVAETGKPYAEALIALGKTDKVPELLFDAISYFKSKNSLQSLGECYSTLGQSYFINSDYNKALEYFFEARRAFAYYNNLPETGSADIDIASTYLLLKDTAKAYLTAKEAEKALREVEYEPGLTSLYTFWGKYYTEINQFAKAEESFNRASVLAKKNNLRDKETEILRYLSILKRKQKNNVVADSINLEYADRIAKQKERAIILNELQQTINTNKIKDTNLIRLLTLMYSPGGAALVKKELNGRSLADIVNLDSMLILDHALIPHADSNSSIAFNRQLVDMEFKYKTRQIRDSLLLQQQLSIIQQNKLSQRSWIIAAILFIALLVTVFAILQVRNRKRAEADKNEIQTLKEEINHRISNTLAEIASSIRRTKRTSVDKESFTLLEERVQPFMRLYEILSDKQAEDRLMQQYLDEICSGLNKSYGWDRNISINIDAPASIDRDRTLRIGLIVNELVTNAFKYAFNDKKDGHIDIKFTHSGKDGYRLLVSDDGQGMKTDKTGTGLLQVKAIAQELRAHIDQQNKDGTGFEFYFI